MANRPCVNAALTLIVAFGLVVDRVGNRIPPDNRV
jgi:hypothetical protein